MNITVLSVLRSGGLYDGEWVRKLKDACYRNLTVSFTFRCLTDLDLPRFWRDGKFEVPCDTIKLQHDWPGWWSKIEMFRPGVITEPTLYLDLDTVIVRNIDHLADLDYDFSMLRNFHQPDFVGSGVMWFRNPETVPYKVYEKFVRQPQAYIEHHDRVRRGSHLGDQAFIWDTLKGEIDTIKEPGIKSYKYHCRTFLPPDASIVCFHGPPRLGEVKADWLTEHWR